MLLLRKSFFEKNCILSQHSVTCGVDFLTLVKLVDVLGTSENKMHIKAGFSGKGWEREKGFVGEWIWEFNKFTEFFGVFELKITEKSILRLNEWQFAWKKVHFQMEV